MTMRQRARATKEKPSEKTVLASSLRGGDSSSRKKNDDNSVEALKMEALASMKRCSRAALLAGVVGVISILFEEADGQGLWSLNLFDVVNAASVLHRFVVGIGIYQLYTLFSESGSDEVDMDAGEIFDVAKTMSQVWMSSAAVLVWETMVMSCSLKKQFWNLFRSPPAVILALYGVISIPVTITAKSAARSAEKKEGAPGNADYASTRSMGFVAARNMRLCIAAFAAMGVTELVLAISETGYVDIAFGLLDVLESFTIGGLLLTLNRSFLSSVVKATKGGKSKPEDYLDLYQAQRGFYGKIASVFNSQSFFRLLPFVVSAGKAALPFVKK